MSSDMKEKWHKCIAKHVQSVAESFASCDNDKERLKVCWGVLKHDPDFNCIVRTVRANMTSHHKSYVLAKEHTQIHDSVGEVRAGPELPRLAKDSHPQILSGSTVIEINYNQVQGRYLQAREAIKAGDVLILEKPYAAVLAQNNRDGYCSDCFVPLNTQSVFHCPGCQEKYCSLCCWKQACCQYHTYECGLQPLLEMLEISEHLALRILLVTGAKQLSEFLCENEQKSSCEDLCFPDANIRGCTTIQGVYSGDYQCVYNLVTNRDMQPPQALVLYALTSALVTEVAYDYIYSDTGQLNKEMMGCLMLHHLEQMPCNIHAITTVVSKASSSGVSSKEQQRIAAAIYPTVSLMNHACDPDVIVSFLGRHLVVRATHNIQSGEEIAHCYGPSASRMTRAARQNLLQKQYFFICGCSACKSDEDLEVQSLFNTDLMCPQCSSVVLLLQRPENDTVLGECSKCATVQDLSAQVKTMKDTARTFNKAMEYLELGQFNDSRTMLKECLRKREAILDKFSKRLAETHDALARCYASIGDFREASKHCEQSTMSVRRRFGAQSVEYGHEAHKFAQLLFNVGDMKKASAVIDDAIQVLSIHYGKQYCDVKELQHMKMTLG